MLDATVPAAVKTERLYRMMMPDHTCPYGLKALDLLKRSGFAVEDHHLATRQEVEAFKASHDVATTPQIFVGDRRIGGYDDLRRYLGKRVTDPKPLWAQALCLCRDGRDAYYPVHGELEPWTIKRQAHNRGRGMLNDRAIRIDERVLRGVQVAVA